MRVPSVSPVSKENQVFWATRERLELRGRRVWLASEDAMALMDRRVKLDGSVLQAAKETQATEVPMVTLGMSVNAALLELMERREIPAAPVDLVLLARLESLDRRERGEVLDHLASPDRKEPQELLDLEEAKESWEGEGTMGQRVLKGQMELREKRVKWGPRACEGFQVNRETKVQRETMVCQAPEDHQGPQGSLGEMVQEVTLVMLGQEGSPDSLDQREIMEDLALAILDQEGHRVTEERRVIVDPVAAGETVVIKATLELKEPRENRVSQGLMVNLALEDQEESLDVTATQAPREIPASLNVMS